MIEVVCNDRLGKKIRVKCNEDDTIGDLKKLIAAQTGTRPEKIRIQKWRKSLSHLLNMFPKKPSVNSTKEKKEEKADDSELIMNQMAEMKVAEAETPFLLSDIPLDILIDIFQLLFCPYASSKQIMNHPLSLSCKYFRSILWRFYSKVRTIDIGKKQVKTLKFTPEITHLQLSFKKEKIGLSYFIDNVLKENPSSTEVMSIVQRFPKLKVLRLVVENKKARSFSLDLSRLGQVPSNMHLELYHMACPRGFPAGLRFLTVDGVCLRRFSANVTSSLELISLVILSSDFDSGKSMKGYKYYNSNEFSDNLPSTLTTLTLHSKTPDTTFRKDLTVIYHPVADLVTCTLCKAKFCNACHSCSEIFEKDNPLDRYESCEECEKVVCRNCIETRCAQNNLEQCIACEVWGCADCMGFNHCEECGEICCGGCEDMRQCEGCGASCCGDCSIIRTCNDCGVSLCDGCGNIRYCDVCCDSYCMECRIVEYCVICSQSICNSCDSDVKFCGKCNECFCTSCRSGKDGISFLLCTSECEEEFCSTCHPIHVCFDPKEGCGSCPHCIANRHHNNMPTNPADVFMQMILQGIHANGVSSIFQHTGPHNNVEASMNPVADLSPLISDSENEEEENVNGASTKNNIVTERKDVSPSKDGPRSLKIVSEDVALPTLLSDEE